MPAEDRGTGTHPQLELQAIVSCLAWVLEMEIRFSNKQHALNH